jgi:predicted GNAT family N-acyltransferase
MLTALLEHARARGQASVFLHAQVSAIPFYAKFGFVEKGKPFMDAGIPHRLMIMSLS